MGVIFGSLFLPSEIPLSATVDLGSRVQKFWEFLVFVKWIKNVQCVHKFSDVDGDDDRDDDDDDDDDGHV